MPRGIAACTLYGARWGHAQEHSGNLGVEAVVCAPADGYTLLGANSANAISAGLYEKLNYNLIRDIAAVASVVREPQVMEVNPSFQAKRFLSSSPTPRPTRVSEAGTR